MPTLQFEPSPDRALHLSSRHLPPPPTANACSGQGDCDTKDQCNCYVGYYGGDCSLRVCPVGTAFVDTPLGDLDHNGAVSPSSYSKVQWSQYKQPEVWPTSAAQGGFAAQPGETHFAVECSGKGSCDRALGVCECYDGFTGAACQRSEYKCTFVVGVEVFL